MNLRRPKKRSLPLPTEAELEILNILWSIGPSTVREVHEALSGKRTGYTTVLKQMQVMAEKGLLLRNERYRSHVYEARLAKEANTAAVGQQSLAPCIQRLGEEPRSGCTVIAAGVLVRASGDPADAG